MVGHGRTALSWGNPRERETSAFNRSPHNPDPPVRPSRRADTLRPVKAPATPCNQLSQKRLRAKMASTLFRGQPRYTKKNIVPPSSQPTHGSVPSCPLPRPAAAPAGASHPDGHGHRRQMPGGLSQAQGPNPFAVVPGLSFEGWAGTAQATRPELGDRPGRPVAGPALLKHRGDRVPRSGQFRSRPGSPQSPRAPGHAPATPGAPVGSPPAGGRAWPTPSVAWGLLTKHGPPRLSMLCRPRP